MSNRPASSDDTVVFALSSAPPEHPTVKTAALRRALEFGRTSRLRLPDSSFRDAEPVLRATWEKKGEATGWDWVRAAVRAGFEDDLPDGD
jgi:hypothetical protein